MKWATGQAREKLAIVMCLTQQMTGHYIALHYISSCSGPWDTKHRRGGVGGLSSPWTVLSAGSRSAWFPPAPLLHRKSSGDGRDVCVCVGGGCTRRVHLHPPIIVILVRQGLSGKRLRGLCLFQPGWCVCVSKWGGAEVGQGISCDPVTYHRDRGVERGKDRGC